MENTPLKKVVVSYLITSILIFCVSAVSSSLGLFGKGAVIGSGTMSTQMFIAVQFAIVLMANAVLHGVFYFGGFNSSPIAKGVGTGMVLGLTYFLVSVFGLGMFDLGTDSVSLLASAMGGRLFEYCTGGIMTAVISVSDIHKWGLLRAI